MAGEAQHTAGNGGDAARAADLQSGQSEPVMAGRVSHAPGPWFVVEHPDQGAPRWWVVQDPETWIDRVASVPDYSHLPPGVGLATAVLIAAAPELLEASRYALGLLTGNMDGDWAIGGDPIAMLRAAIHKATEPGR